MTVATDCPASVRLMTGQFTAAHRAAIDCALCPGTIHTATSATAMTAAAALAAHSGTPSTRDRVTAPSAEVSAIADRFGRRPVMAMTGAVRAASSSIVRMIEPLSDAGGATGGT